MDVSENFWVNPETELRRELQRYVKKRESRRKAAEDLEGLSWKVYPDRAFPRNTITFWITWACDGDSARHIRRPGFDNGVRLYAMLVGWA